MDSLLSVNVTDEGVVDVATSPATRDDVSQVETDPLRSMLHIDSPSGQERTQLKAIWDYLAEGANGVGDVLYQFRQLENRMTAPKLGESRLGKMYNYVTLQSKVKQYEKELEAL